jgi:kinesin family protein 15
MLGELEDADHRPSDKRGMTPRVFEYLFSRITEVSQNRNHHE